jgi:hypothetical protein
MHIALTRAISRMRTVLTRLVAAVLVFTLLAQPADARRKFSFGGGNKSTAAAKPSAAMAKTGKVLKAALLAALVIKAAKGKLVRVYELDRNELTTLADGRQFHIGRLSRMFGRSSYVGYISRSEYIDLNAEQLLAVLSLEGFETLAEFEKQLASVPPLASSEPAAEDAADDAGALSGPWVTFILAIGTLGLLGFISYCAITIYRRRDADGSGPAVGLPSARVARVPSVEPRVAANATPLPARAAQTLRSAAPARSTMPLATVRARTAMQAPLQATVQSVSPRRAPRDLGALVRAPALASRG